MQSNPFNRVRKTQEWLGTPRTAVEFYERVSMQARRELAKQNIDSIDDRVLWLAQDPKLSVVQALLDHATLSNDLYVKLWEHHKSIYDPTRASIRERLLAKENLPAELVEDIAEAEIVCQRGLFGFSSKHEAAMDSLGVLLLISHKNASEKLIGKLICLADKPTRQEIFKQQYPAIPQPALRFLAINPEGLSSKQLTELYTDHRIPGKHLLAKALNNPALSDQLRQGLIYLERDLNKITRQNSLTDMLLDPDYYK